MSQQVIGTTGNDVVDLLKDQHKRVKALFGQVLAAEGHQRVEAFYALRCLMAVHETAEEEIVHPVAKKALPGGAAIVAARLKEEKEATKAVAEIEKLDVDSEEFLAAIRKLQAAVLAHAESEEREEFNKLAFAVDEPRLLKMRKSVELVESLAPARIHPGVESAATTMLAVSFASMLDRVRDAMGAKPS